VVEAGGALLVTSREVVLRVDPVTGDRTVVSSPGVGAGPDLGFPFDLALEPDATILVADTLLDAVFRVDPDTGDRSIVTICSSPFCSTQVGGGPALMQTWAIAREADGRILLVDLAADTLYDVDPVSGDRTAVAFNALGGAGGMGPIFATLSGIAVDGEGTVWLLDYEAQSLMVVDPTSGDREIVSRAGGFGAGPKFILPRRLAIVPHPLEIGIDVRPRSPSNVVNPAARGRLPIALLGSEAFDPADVEVATLALGPAGAAPLRDTWLRDVDRDGFDDLVVGFQTSEIGLVGGEVELCLEGRALDGAAFSGCDAITTVPSCGTGFELAFLPLPLMWLYRRRTDET
jgi:hypothetical protein